MISTTNEWNWQIQIFNFESTYIFLLSLIIAIDRVMHNLEIDEVNFYLSWPVTIYLYHWSESDYHLYATKVISTEAKLPGFDSIRRYSWIMTIQIFFFFFFFGWIKYLRYIFAVFFHVPMFVCLLVCGNLFFY